MPVEIKNVRGKMLILHREKNHLHIHSFALH